MVIDICVYVNSSIERVEEFKYLGTVLTNKNSIQEEIKSKLKLGNACYYSVQNLLSSSLLPKKLKIKIYRCPRRNVPNFGRVFLMLNYTDITQNTYVQS